MSKRAGGWERMKAANEKKSRENEELRSTSKIDTFFASLRSNVPSTSDGADTDTAKLQTESAEREHSIGSQQPPDHAGQPQAANIHFEAHDDNQDTISSSDARFSAIIGKTVIGHTSDTTTSMFSNDPGLWDSVSEDML